jgi:hypothetical protein
MDLARSTSFAMHTFYHARLKVRDGKLLDRRPVMVHHQSMPGPAELQTSFSERKLLRWLLLFYFLFILYGSLIPFRLSDDPEFVRSQLTRFLTPPYDHGVKKFSLPDAIDSVDEIPLRIAKIEWLPMGSYYHAEPQAALFDLAKKLFLLGPLGFLVAGSKSAGDVRRRQRLAILVGLMVGLTLEAGQIALRSRTPSMTDVLLFGGACWAGAVIFNRYSLTRTYRSDTSLSHPLLPTSK